MPGKASMSEIGQKPHLRKVRFWRKPDIEVYLNLDQFVPFAGATSILFVMDESKFFTKPRHH